MGKALYFHASFCFSTAFMTDTDTATDAALTEILHYGAVLNSPLSSPALPFEESLLNAARQRRESPTPDRQLLLEEGAQIWRNVCTRVIEASTQPLLVPLSAGLDSRAILAGLRGCGAPVRAVTYGVPGAFDYELAPRVARCARAEIERIDLRDVSFDRDKLLAMAARPGPVSSVLDMYFNRMLAAHCGRDYSYVNGFMGDPLAGKNLSGEEMPDWSAACRTFAQRQRSARHDVLTAPSADVVARLPQSPFVSSEMLSFEAQLNYGVRQQCLVRPIVCPPDHEVFTPFTDPEWVVFMLGLPDEMRRNRAFFVALFQYAFPELFALPTTASGGLPLGASRERMRRYKRRLKRVRRFKLRLQRVFPGVHVPPADRGWQYIDFPALLRGDNWLAQLFADSMARLDESAIVPWIDGTALLAAHRAGEGDHFKALNVLLNLDIVREARPELLSASG